jgi:hypothetical protein
MLKLIHNELKIQVKLKKVNDNNRDKLRTFETVCIQ